MSARPGSTEVSRIGRPIYFGMGLLLTGLGFIGYVVPVMPGTIFFILALWAFKKSSPRLEDWLLNRSIAAPVLQDWERDRSIRLRTKFWAIGMLWASIATSCWFLWRRNPDSLVIPLLLVIALVVSLYVWTRKTRVH